MNLHLIKISLKLNDWKEQYFSLYASFLVICNLFYHFYNQQYTIKKINIIVYLLLLFENVYYYYFYRKHNNCAWMDCGQLNWPKKLVTAHGKCTKTYVQLWWHHCRGGMFLILFGKWNNFFFFLMRAYNVMKRVSLSLM